MVDGIRQGNENDEIDIFNYVTEGTFDAYMYQILQRKQEYISQIMTSKAIVRSAEDVDEKALSYAEIKALAAGNPLIIKKTELDTQVAKLQLLKQSYLNQKYNLEDMIVKHYPIEIKRLEDKLLYIQEDIKKVEDNTNIENEEKFSPMLLNGKQYNEKISAGKQILNICSLKQNTESEEIGEYRGLKMFLSIDSFDKKFVINLQGKYSYKVDLGSDIHGNITRIDNVIASFNKELETTKEKLEETKIQFENAKEAVEVLFDKEDELKQKTKELNEINIQLNLDKKDNEILDDEGQENKTEKNEKECQEYEKDNFR